MTSQPGFDPVGGRLRLTRGLLADMCAANAGDPVTREQEMLAAGLLVGDGLHPRLVPIAEIAARPLVRLKLDVLASTPLDCEGWIGESFALLLAASSSVDEVFEATFLSRSLLPSQLARCVDLGPRARPKVTEPIEIDQGLLEAILSVGERLPPSQLESLLDPADEVVAAWLETLSALSSGPRGRWRVGVWWNSAAEAPSARSLEILDSDLGYFFVSHADREDRKYPRLQLRPVTPSQVWRLLCALLPPAEDVAEPLGL